MKIIMSNASSSKNHSKKSKDSGRDRDRNRASDSGSNQCDTPPLQEKDGSHGKFAGVGPDSIICVADQNCIEITAEAATNLAEDVTYKLRQTISNIALQSHLMKKSRVETSDVNTMLSLSDTGPCVWASSTQYVQVGDEKIYTDVDELINVSDLALTPQTYIFSSPPTLSTEWITDDRSLNHISLYSSNISVHLQTYYTKVARSILNLRKKPKEVAVQDLMTNTRIGPIFPNLFNLAVLVLNDDNLNALKVLAKNPLQSNVLDMVDALCSNPCCFDTNIQQQFQRLFPVMVSNILGNGPLAEKMVNILTKITRTWPSFITIGKSILFEYLSHSTKDRLTGPMIRCVMALGRQALFDCLNSEDNLSYLDDCLMTPWRKDLPDIRSPMLDVATVLLRSEPTTYLEDYVGCDYVLCEMLGDSIDPRRTIFPKSKKSTTGDPDKMAEDDLSFPNRSYLRRPKIRIIPTTPKVRNGVHKQSVFEPTRFSTDMSIRLKIRNCRSLHKPRKLSTQTNHTSMKQVVVASGLYLRFKYKLHKPNPPPLLGAMLL